MKTGLRLGVVVLAAGLLAGCGASKATPPVDLRGQKATRPAAASRQALHRGMSFDEVKAVLGEPDDVTVYTGTHASERWQYYHYPECAPHLTTKAPTTELVFVNGRLARWLSRKKPARKEAGSQ
jgi:outer membrane protein assembly factor BamE (lipoprotein component of BamABCDE complex)